MITDTELETWRQEWREHTEPLPEWQSKIRRQNLRMAAGVVVICACLAGATVWTLQHRSSLATGFASGLWFSCIAAGGYAWWVRRGAWKPTAQTTLAYMELAHRRAIAKVRQLRFSFYFLLAVTLGFAAVVAWDWKRFAVRDAAILAAIAIELLFFRYFERRKRREVEETKKLIDGMKE